MTRVGSRGMREKLYIRLTGYDAPVADAATRCLLGELSEAGYRTKGPVDLPKSRGHRLESEAGSARSLTRHRRLIVVVNPDAHLIGLVSRAPLPGSVAIDYGYYRYRVA